MSDEHEGRSHGACAAVGEHICFVPSGRVCIESGCEEPAGTHWGPYWCPEHDRIRLDRVSDQLRALRRALVDGD